MKLQLLERLIFAYYYRTSVVVFILSESIAIKIKKIFLSFWMAEHCKCRI